MGKNAGDASGLEGAEGELVGQGDFELLEPPKEDAETAGPRPPAVQSHCWYLSLSLKGTARLPDFKGLSG